MATDVERIKKNSRLLRGTLRDSVADPTTLAVAPDDTQLIKLHGSYQQDDRDLRDERQRQKLDPLYSFMLRTRLPGGVCTAKQWLLLDDLARTLGGGTLRLTTRQAFQIHGIAKPNLRPVIQGLHRALLDSLAACGDVNRNVMAPAWPDSARHDALLNAAISLSTHLLPRTNAYAEMWYGDDEKDSYEPIYGDTYLPRKFKAAFALPPHNDVDVFAQDLGFIAVDGGYNVTVGGGLGHSHGDATTYPRTADVIGFIAADDVNRVAEAVVTVQRDWGNRDSRKHARLKYTIDARGLAAFTAEVERRAGITFAPARPFSFVDNADLLGWHSSDGEHRVGLAVESGRVRGRVQQGLRRIATTLVERDARATFRLTGNQNVVLAGLNHGDRAAIAPLITAFDLDTFKSNSLLSLRALSCVALPTCGLAMAEAERALPNLTALFDDALRNHALTALDITVRITGCPNGCARPSLAEVALIGKGPDSYALHVGGSARGDRLNKKVKDGVTLREAASVFDGWLGRFVVERNDQSESFGDWASRTLWEAS